MRFRSILILLALAIAGVVVWKRMSASDPEAPAATRPPPSTAVVRTSPPAPSNPSLKTAPDSRSGGLRVKVLSEEKPLEGARVTILPEDNPERPRSFATMADGTQEMIGIPVGEYSVFVHHPGHVPEVQRAMVRDAISAEIVFRLKKGAEIEGCVTDPQVRPIEGASIGLSGLAPEEAALASISAVSGADGRYRLSGLASRVYTLTFRHARHRPTQKEGIVIHQPTDRVTVDAVLSPGTSISGRVVDDQSRPIAGAKLMAMNEEASGAVSAQDGRFILYGLGDKVVTLRTEAPGFAAIFLPAVAPNSTDLEVRLPREATLSGRVEASPLPVAIAFKLWKYEPSAKRELGLQYLAHYGETGEFTVPNLAPGDYRAEIEAEGYEAIDRPTFSLRAGQTVSNIIIRMRRTP